MRDNLKNILITICFLAIIAGTTLASLAIEDNGYSSGERRQLAVMPQLKPDTLLSGEFFAASEKYLLDHIIYRDFFRGIKAFTVYNILRQKENNGLYIANGQIGKLEYPLRQDSIEQAAAMFNTIHEQYFPDAKAWLAVIPDKNQYLAPAGGYPYIDYAQVVEIISGIPGSIHLLEIAPFLSAGDYYNTDIHWRQENLLPLADYLLQSLGSDIAASGVEYRAEDLYPFRGSFYGQIALPVDEDNLVYLTSEYTDSARVFDFAANAWNSVYNQELFSGKDPYDVYLGGAKPLLTIYNDEPTADRELLIFRDSFASSLAPLLLPGYSKVTLVDLRYMQLAKLSEFIDAGSERDILFLYSIPVLNNSAMLR